MGTEPPDRVALLGVLAAAARDSRPDSGALDDLLTGLVNVLHGECGSVAAYPGGGLAYPAGSGDELVGRVVLATPGADWALGRPVRRDEPILRRLASGDCLDVDVAAERPSELADQLLARGMTRAAVAGVLVAGRLVGSIQVYFRGAPTGGLDPAGRYAMLVAARLADRIPPVHGDAGLASALADGLAVLDADGLVRAWNPAAELLTGIPSAGAIGRPMPYAVPAVGQAAEHELPDGRWIQLLCAELADSDERVVTFRDSTEAHRREQAKDLFVATTGHELRTPVTVIRGYAETLDRGWERLDEESRREAIRKLRDRAERLAVLVDRLLLADDEGGTAAVPAEFDLVAALRAAVAPLAAEGPHRLVVDLPAALPPALGDETSIRTVLSELVRNARKYSPDGGDITLTAAADERTVYFRVTDRGIGVAPDDLERAFDRFWQAEGSDRRRFGGVGLGLYLVRRIVEGQHGWVSLRPASGRHSPDGTVAEVRLPRAAVTSGEA